MTNKEFQRIGESLIRDIPGFAAKGPLLFVRPIEHALRGVCFDRSIDARRFFAQVFVLPLFVPTKHIGFNFGWRLGGGAWSWDADDPNLIDELGLALRREALPFLATVNTVSDIPPAAVSLRKSGDPHVRQAIAYSLARAGDIPAAVEALDALVRSLNRESAWQRDMAERAHGLAVQLLSDPAAAQRRMDAWEAETAQHLALGKLESAPRSYVSRTKGKA